MKNSTIALPTESEMVSALKPGQFFFISDGSHFGLYFNKEQEVVGVKPQAPNFQWAPEFNFNLK